MTRILLIRHGNTDYVNRKLCGRLPGIALNEEGVQQAERVGRYLAAETPVDAIYSSPLERAHQTARIIARVRDSEMRVRTDERFNEMEFGEWTGAPFPSLQASESWQRYNSNRSLHAPPGGESLTNVQARAWECLSEIYTEHSGGVVALVTHADVIRALLVLFLGMPLDLLLRLQIGPCSISETVLGGDYPVVPFINLVPGPMHSSTFDSK